MYMYVQEDNFNLEIGVDHCDLDEYRISTPSDCEYLFWCFHW